MKRLSISPSKLEGFRIFYEEEYNGVKTAEDVIASIKGEFIRNEKMIMGSAYHQLIEHGGERYKKWPAGSDQAIYEVREEESKEVISFTHTEAEPALLFKAWHPDMVFEQWANLEWGNVLGYDVSMKMRVDGMEGLVLYENKTSHSSRRPTIDTYDRSTQWRCYLLAFPDAQCVEYNTFWRYYRKYVGFWKVEHDSFRFGRDPGMYQYCLEYMEGLIRFAENQGIIEYLMIQ